MQQPELKEGEVYLGAIINPDGTGEHSILLPGDKDDGNWQDAMDWAKQLGGDLPNRVEQVLMFDKSRGQFKKDWYWSNTTHEREAGWAWSQYFNIGHQNFTDKSSELRARAVRRVPI